MPSAIAATAAGAAAVDTHYHIALSSIILLPVIAPAVEHALRTRTAVLRHHDRVFFTLLHGGRLYDITVELNASFGFHLEKLFFRSGRMD